MTTSKPRSDYTRDELIAICERAIVPQTAWTDRDSQRSQKSIGKAWALLKAGCDWELSDDPATDDRTIWIRILSEGFKFFEGGIDPDEDRNYYLDDDLFYLPTPSRLDAAGGKDWY